ncbi:hypothetical protein [Streptomyces sp. 4F14]|uniref:hypothetical protein n=1 Tax=Streptomyces sp. 4F14 TaxID=3394380 RepID=UPI003A8689FB
MRRVRSGLRERVEPVTSSVTRAVRAPGAGPVTVAAVPESPAGVRRRGLTVFVVVESHIRGCGALNITWPFGVAAWRLSWPSSLTVSPVAWVAS